MRASGNLTNQQKGKLKDLRGIVGNAPPDKALTDLLKRFNWNTDQAMNEWFNSGMESQYKFQAANAGKVNESNIK